MKVAQCPFCGTAAMKVLFPDNGTLVVEKGSGQVHSVYDTVIEYRCNTGHHFYVQDDYGAQNENSN
jgi:hypothetical protein